MLQKQPNAALQAPLEAAATQERRLEAVACKRGVRLGAFHWAGEWDGFCCSRLFPLPFLRSC
jgi:hypothetical protein